MMPVQSSEAVLCRMVDGRSMIIIISGATTKSYTLETAVIGTAGLEMSDRNLKLIEMLECDEERSDLMLAEVGVAKPRPRCCAVLCLVCGCALGESYTYHRHKKLHDGEVRVCEGCNGAFADKYFYNAHKGKCYHYCPFKNSQRACMFKAKDEVTVKKHLKRKHYFEKL